MNIIVMKLVKFFAPMVIDFLIPVLEDLAKKTDNQIDNHAVETIKQNAELIKEAVKRF